MGDAVTTAEERTSTSPAEAGVGHASSAAPSAPAFSPRMGATPPSIGSCGLLLEFPRHLHQRVVVAGLEVGLERVHLLLDAVLLALDALVDGLLHVVVGDFLELLRRHVAHLHLLAVLGLR